MTRFVQAVLIAVTAVALLPRTGIALARAEGSAGWLNVQDFGASGSEFQTTAVTTAGSNQITVENPGDFQVGQGVMVSRCSIRTSGTLHGPGEPYSTWRALKEGVEFRGYDGSAGSWLVYILEVDGANPATFRWSDDLARTWKGTKVPITFDWQPLGGGIEVKLARQEWQPGHMVTCSMRDQLASTITKIEGKVLTLADAANRSANDAVVRHNDQRALQAAIAQAVKEKRNVTFPAGHYRLSGSLTVSGAAITIEGQSGEDTLLDISDGSGACFSVSNCPEVTIRNFRMVGHTGFDEAAGSFTTSSGFGFWACALKGCNGISLTSTDRALIENVHASRMASEAFYASGTYRRSDGEQDRGWASAAQTRYQKSLTYLRCSVTDCAANAFNNNDVGENTSVLYCRIDGANWHAAEMPARFLKLIGNYVRNSGPFTIGDMSHREDDLHKLGCGQSIVENNVFEGIGRCGGIVVNHGSSQVVIANNLFINFNGPAITASSYTVRTSFPSNTVTIRGNIIDMTYSGEKPAARTGITVSASNAIVSDNQIYVRGQYDPLVTGIHVAEPARNVSVHDNLIRNCNYGLRTSRAASRVTRVIDSKTFLEDGLPLEWKDSHRYRGWNLVWISAGKPAGFSVIDSFDPGTLQFKLRAPAKMKAGDRFEVYSPTGADWSVHHNTITGCLNPVSLDSYGGASSFDDNTVAAEGVSGVRQAVEVAGSFSFAGNRFVGFDQPDCSVLLLHPGRSGKPVRNLFRDNVFEKCRSIVSESRKGLWQAATATGNVFIECGTVPRAGAPSGARDRVVPLLVAAPPAQVLHARRLAAPFKVDGSVAEWPWRGHPRAITLSKSPAGDALGGPVPSALAAHDAASLYLAVRVPLPKAGKPRIGGGAYHGDGVEVSFQNTDAKRACPIYVLWGGADGRFETVAAGGTSPAQRERARKAIRYAARVGKAEWTCEWRIPFAAIGVNAASARRLRFNVGALSSATEAWSAWYATGGPLYEVGSAGDLVMEGR